MKKKKWTVALSQAASWSASDNREFSPLPYLILSFHHDEDGLLIIFGWLFWQWFAWGMQLE